jgi:hypothetical protein
MKTRLEGCSGWLSGNNAACRHRLRHVAAPYLQFGRVWRRLRIISYKLDRFPVITLAAITGLPVDKLSVDVGRICTPVSFMLPAYLIAAVAGAAGVWKVWPAVLVCGLKFRQRRRIGVLFYAYVLHLH